MAYDGTDDGAPARRLAARPAHLARGERMRVAGELPYAAALLDDDEQMRGSMMVLDLPDRAAVDRWLEQEPYVTGQVWERVDVSLCRPGPAFLPS